MIKKISLMGLIFFSFLMCFSCVKNEKNEIQNETYNETYNEILDETYNETTESINAVKKELHVTDNGETCYVHDYAGGMLDPSVYGEFKKLVFSENEIKDIENMDNMLSPYRFYEVDDCGESFEETVGEFNVEEVDFTGLDTSKVTSMKCLFNKNSMIRKINFGDIDTSNVIDMYKMFCECTNLEEITFGTGFNTSKVKVMRGMFFYCSKLGNLDLSNWDTSSCEDMSYMFYRCENIGNLDLGNFDTSKCENMEYMFGNMRKLKNINVDGFNTSSCKSMRYMFYRNHELESLDLNSFDTINVSNMSYMFYCCYKLNDLKISNFDTRQVNNYDYMFYFCESLKMLNLNKFHIGDDSISITMDYMFRYCDDLEYLDMSNFDFSKARGVFVFDGDYKLRDFKYDINNLYKNTSDNTNINMYYIALSNEIRNLSNNNEYVKYADKRKSISNKDIMFMDNAGWEKLLKNDFVVKQKSEYMEFFNYYEETRYDHFPNYVTSDSILHTYHLYFDYLMKSVEKNGLYDKILDITKKCVKKSEELYDNCKGTQYENEAKAVLTYFSVPALVLDGDYNVKINVKEKVDSIYQKIMGHEGISLNDAFIDFYDENEKLVDPNYDSYFAEDFSQYKPRGHYDGDSKLENYFRVFMWYGRIGFTSNIDSFNKCAILINLIFDDEEMLKEYKDIKNTIYYFAGTSDDVGYNDYIKCIDKVYGTRDIMNIIADTSKLSIFKSEIKKLNESRINSSPLVYELNINDSDHIVQFRLIGQTYTYDAEIFKNLIFDYVAKTDDNEKRYLPDFLDVPATFYSDTALNILKENGDFKYPKLDKQLDNMRKTMPEKLKNDTSDVLYVKWLKCLLTLIDTENNISKYPKYMQNDEHKKKSLETFAGSYAELKHDTILYTKQTYGVAECGEGGEPEFYDEEDDVVDNKGYVEPQKELYLSLYDMATSMEKVFGGYGMLSSTDSQFLNNFANLAKRLAIIADKELNGERLLIEEYELIEGYGATIEHLIIDSGAYDEYEAGNPQKSTAIVADIATGELNGDYLAREIATGNPIRIYVLVEVDGVYKVCQGAAYDFYQFEVTVDNRMTDIEWRTKMNFDKGIFDKDYTGSTYAYDSYDEETGEYIDNTYQSKNNDDLKFQDWTNSYKFGGSAYTERINYCTSHHCGGYVKINICGFTNS